jgi:hypothetical protein
MPFFLKLTCNILSHPLIFGDSPGPGDNVTAQNHELRLREINTLEWDELLLTNDSNNLTAPTGGNCIDPICSRASG